MTGIKESKVSIETSLVIPCYNEIRFIQRTLESVIGEADEIILSDNASTDGTSDICQSFADKYPEIKYYRQNENLYAADNTLFCINKSNGKFIRMLGGHDMIWPGSTKKMLTLLRTDNKAVVVYQNHSIYFNPDYTINSYFTTNNQLMEQRLKSDNVAERVSAIPYGSYDGSMFYCLYRTESLMKNLNKYNFLTSIPTDQGLIVILAKEGKILAEKETACLLMRPRSLPRSYNENIIYLKEELSRVTNKLSNPYAFRFAIICEQYTIAKELEMLGTVPDNFAKNIIKHYLKNNYLIPNISLLKERDLYISDKKDALRKEVLLEFENINKKMGFRFIKKILNIFKYFVPFGLLRLLQKIIEYKSKQYKNEELL